MNMLSYIKSLFRLDWPRCCGKRMKYISIEGDMRHMFRCSRCGMVKVANQIRGSEE